MAKKATKQTFVWEGEVLTVGYPTIKREVKLDLSRVPEEQRENLLRHGAKQKLGDAASGQDAEAKFEMASRIVEALYNNEWEISGERDVTGIVREALERLGRDPKKIAKLDEETLKAAARNAAVKVEIHRIRLERAEALAAEAENDLDELFEE